MPGKASSLLYDIHPLAELALIGLGNRVGLYGFAASTAEQELEAIHRLSRRIGVELSEMVLEPLGPGQKRPAPLSVFAEGGWKTAGIFVPSTRGVRYTLSLPIARSTLAAPAGREGKAAPSYVYPQGPLLGGVVKLDAPKPPITEPCTIGFTIR
jgi:hypothetical protein